MIDLEYHINMAFHNLEMASYMCIGSEMHTKFMQHYAHHTREINRISLEWQEL